ncbi:MAG: TIGR04255 family protein [Oscillospiraceae bacterium]|nr:TIGR04255 family protein [Oscillospiraceae bacterium]
MFSNEERCLLKNNQLAEVICQLRFPEILKIGAEHPVRFQEQIRDEYPQFSKRMEAPTPSPSPANDQKINYQFTSADGLWRVNLTGNFISLACNRYTCWEDFAKRLDKPLAAFIQIYQPAYFQRIGLRYLNFISRKNLALEGIPFRDLFQNMYLGPMADEEVPENTALRCGVDAELAIRGGCKVKIHAGPGMIMRKTPNGTQQDKEVRFIFDQDLYMGGNIPVNYSAGALQTLHAQAYSIFRGAITDTLFDALDPVPIP